MGESYSRRDFLTGVLVCGTATAATLGLYSGSRPVSDVELRLATGRDPSGGARDLLIKLWNDTNAHTKVSPDIDEGQTGDQLTNMEAKARNGEVDIVNLDTIHLRRFIDEGLITPVDVGDAGPFLKSTLIAQQHEGNSFWAVPFNTDVGMLFERPGPGDGAADHTLKTVIDELADPSRKIAGRQFVGQLGPRSSADDEAFVVNVLEHALAEKSEILGKDGLPADELTLWQAALDPLHRAILQDRVVRSRSEDVSVVDFNVAPRPRYMRNWPVAYRTLQRQSDPDVMTGRIAVRSLSPGILGGQSLAVVKKSRNVARAKEVIRFLTGAEAQKIIAAHGLAPTRIEAYNDDNLKAFIPHLGEIRGAVESARVRPAHKEYRKFSQVVRAHVGQLLAIDSVPLPSRFIDEMRDALS